MPEKKTVAQLFVEVYGEKPEDIDEGVRRALTDLQKYKYMTCLLHGHPVCADCTGETVKRVDALQARVRELESRVNDGHGGEDPETDQKH